MQNQMNLKEIERRAYRSTYQDGLWDIYMGLVVAGVSIFAYRPIGGYRPLNIILAVLLMSAAFGLFQAGKRFITLPRMGQVKFGPERKRKKATLALLLAVLVVFQVALVGLTSFGWFHPAQIANWIGLTGKGDTGLVVVAMIGSLIVGTSMLMIAFFTDFPRGYYIAFLMALAIFLMIFLNQPLYPILIAVLILVPGLILFVRFLRRYPHSKIGNIDG
jgi:hypothetical protein